MLCLKILLSKFTTVLKGNDINMDLEKWGSRGKKELIQILSVGHLRYDRSKQNVKQEKFTEKCKMFFSLIAMIIIIL